VVGNFLAKSPFLDRARSLLDPFLAAKAVGAGADLLEGHGRCVDRAERRATGACGPSRAGNPASPCPW